MNFLCPFAYRYRPKSPLWDRLHHGRSAELFVTMDAPPWCYRWFDRMPGHWQMRRTALALCGFDPVRIASYGPVRSAPPERIQRWLADARRRGERAARRLNQPRWMGRRPLNAPRDPKSE